VRLSLLLVKEERLALMKMAKMISLIGSFAVVTSGSVRAGPLNIAWNGGTPMLLGYSPQLDLGFQDFISLANVGQVAAINLAGVNSINMTWAAPAGYMYAVEPVPAGFNSTGLSFEAIYGNSGQASSLGSITASSLSVHTVYGTSPLTGGAILNHGVLNFVASAGSGSDFAPFAFTSITISADFSGLGTSQTLGIDDPVADSAYPFGILYGDGGLSIISGNPGLASLLTLEPLPSGSVPDDSCTLALAGFGFAGLILVGRKRVAVDC
jgi:hypothetical protein